MGLLELVKRRGRKKEKEVIDEFRLDNSVLTELEPEPVVATSRKGRTSFINDSCEQIMEAVGQIEDAKVEYQAVTSYLADMQKIEMAGDAEKAILEDAAKRIITLTRERSRYQSSELKITDAQFRNIEKYESDIVKAIKQMRQNETYAMAVKNDMVQLDAEKKKLKHQKNDIIEKQKYLKGLSVTVSILVGSLFLLFMGLSYAFETDMRIPYMMTIVMAAAGSFYIFHEAGKNRYSIQIVENKLNRAIALLNKVKIKHVNNTNAMDYAHEKYGAGNALEFENMWQQYLKAKEAQERYRKNTEMLNRYNIILVEEMKKQKVSDPEIWIYQAAALIDRKEMVEVRHRLNVRRQKLRERIDYNTGIKMEAMGRIQGLIAEMPERKTEVIEVLRKYEIEL